CPSENIVYADVDGNIGWVAAALTPVRRGWDGLLPVPGASGAYEWQGFLPTRELPQVHNPSSHTIVTANHNILSPDYRHEIAYEWAPAYRFTRIQEQLKGKRTYTVEDFTRLQHDNTTLPGLSLARLLKAMDLKGSELEPYADLLRGWDGVLSA